MLVLLLFPVESEEEGEGEGKEMGVGRERWNVARIDAQGLGRREVRKCEIEMEGEGEKSGWRVSKIMRVSVRGKGEG